MAERLQEIFNTNRTEFENKWDDLKIFIEYGVVTDEKFAEKAKDFILVKTTEGKYFTLEVYKTLVKDAQTDKKGNLIYLYTNDPVSQHSFITAATEKGYSVLVLDGQLDNHFISWFESKNQDTHFVRVDSEIIDKLIEKESDLKLSITTQQQETLRPVFEAQLPSEEKVSYTVSFEAMQPSEPPVVITQNEFMRRMKDMATMNPNMAFYGQMPDNFNVVINGNNPLVIDILSQVEGELGESLKRMIQKIDSVTYEVNTLTEKIKKEGEKKSDEDQKTLDSALEKQQKLVGDRNEKLRTVGSSNKLVKQIIDLALLSNGMLKGEHLTNFIRRSVELIGK